MDSFKLQFMRIGHSYLKQWQSNFSILIEYYENSPIRLSYYSASSTYNNNPSINSLQVVKKFSYTIRSAFKSAGKLQKTGAQHTQCNMGGHIDLKFPLASGLFKDCQLQYKHRLLKKKKIKRILPRIQKFKVGQNVYLYWLW